MIYKEARTVLKEAFEELLDVSEYAPYNISRVYEFPPQNVQDTPCIIMLGGSGEVTHTFGGTEFLTRLAIERVRLLATGDNYTEAFEFCLELHYNFLDILKGVGGLNGKGVISNISWDFQAAYVVNQKAYVGIDYSITYVMGQL